MERFDLPAALALALAPALAPALALALAAAYYSSPFAYSFFTALLTTWGMGIAVVFSTVRSQRTVSEVLWGSISQVSGSFVGCLSTPRLLGSTRYTPQGYSRKAHSPLPLVSDTVGYRGIECALYNSRSSSLRPNH